ncbi:hypothetical protein JXB41_04600, partial [Candidatus Woesearchaeota archaeon]|nr:hypothetical protein [Candidatus Woesearchaeota archaeon]
MIIKQKKRIREAINELNTRLKQIKDHKRDINDFINETNKRYELKEITEKEKTEIISKGLDNKTEEHWLNYYDKEYNKTLELRQKYENYYEDLIKDNNKTKKISAITVIFLLFAGFLISHNADFTIFSNNTGNTETISISFTGNSLDITNNYGDKIDFSYTGNKTGEIELKPERSIIDKIRFIELKDGGSLALDSLDKIEFYNQKSHQAYAIDPAKLNFTKAVITTKAKGNELYKCKDWNFTEQICYGEWEKIMDIV